MEKETTICFKTTSRVSEALQDIADEKNMSVSALIDAILQDHLRESKPFQKLDHNRRRFERKVVTLSAYLGNPQWQRRDFQEVTILDLSINGIRFSIPKGASLQIDNGSEIDQFMIIFRLPDYSWPINIQITPQRVFETEKDFQIGASLLNPDYCAYTALQQYLN